ncbi:MAG: hypothetical protein MZU91_02720 [Desulfosudis oleivorans]|nr:hypothetical protein [Desulfosudis oleivorans]
MAQGEFPGDAKKALIDTVCRFKSLAIDEELRKIQGELNDAEKTGRQEQTQRTAQDKAGYDAEEKESARPCHGGI